MAKYAAGTTVGAEKSKVEIERILVRYGASSFMTGYFATTAVVMFEAHGRRIKFELKLPKIEDFRARRRSSAQSQHEAEVRRLWRALALAIKAKLEVVASGISTFEQEFLANIVLPDGSTVGSWAEVAVEQAYLGGKMPPLLGSGED